MVRRRTPAQDLGPTKDVAVTYRLNGATQQNGAEKLELTYADHGRVRMDFFQYPELLNPLGSVIFDPPSNRVISVLPQRHGYLQRGVGGLVNPGLFGLNAKMQFSRQGNATIAGHPCTDWSVLNGTAVVGTVCVTDDGVIRGLHATSQRRDRSRQ